MPHTKDNRGRRHVKKIGEIEAQTHQSSETARQGAEKASLLPGVDSALVVQVTEGIAYSYRKGLRSS